MKRDLANGISPRKVVLIVTATAIITILGIFFALAFFPDLFPTASPNTPIFQSEHDTVKTVKLVSPIELNLTQIAVTQSYKTVNFTWTPENPRDNIILTVHFYSEYLFEADIPEDELNKFQSIIWEIDFVLGVNDDVSSSVHRTGFRLSSSSWAKWFERYPSIWTPFNIEIERMDNSDIWTNIQVRFAQPARCHSLLMVN